MFSETLVSHGSYMPCVVSNLVHDYILTMNGHLTWLLTLFVFKEKSQSVVKTLLSVCL